MNTSKNLLYKLQQIGDEDRIELLNVDTHYQVQWATRQVLQKM